jgi:filamentous hemagglutinin family protein
MTRTDSRAAGVSGRRGLAALLLATTMLASPAAMTAARAQAPAPGTLPQGPHVTAGQAAIAGAGSQMTITQGSQRAAINWQSYSIGASAGLTYVQPNAQSIALNRVVGNDPSQIFGRLTANGQVWLINPNGILFGRSARVDVAGLVAATANITMSDQDFVNGTGGRVAFGAPGRADAAIVNQGQITVREAGLAAFVAPAVANQGTITARLGRVSLASANTFTLDLYGDRLVSLAVDDRVVGNARDAQGNPVSAGVENSGQIFAEGGRIALSAQVARGVVDSVVRNSGTLDVRAVTVTRGGTIILSGGDGGV